MNTLEDQIRDYAGFVADETQAYEHHKAQGAHASFAKASEPKKQRRTLALVGILLAGSATTFGVANQFGNGPTQQEVRFLPLSETEQGHYAPSYLPEGFALKAIYKRTDTSREYKRFMIFGRVIDDSQIDDALFAVQVEAEVPDERVVGKIERKLIDGRMARFDSQEANGFDRWNVTVRMEGCGFLKLTTASPSTQEKLAAYVENFSCDDGQVVGKTPTGMDALYDAPWVEGNATQFRYEYVRADVGPLYVVQPLNSLPPELSELLNRLENNFGANTQKLQLGALTLRVSPDPKEAVTYLSWTQGNARLSVGVSPLMRMEETRKVIASFRKLTNEEWDAMLKAHPLKLTTIVDGKAVTADSVAQ